MVKRTEKVIERGAWRRKTISIDPEIGLSDICAAGSAEAAAELLKPFADEVRKLQPPGDSPSARVRGQFNKLRDRAVKVLAAAGYPVEPGAYHFDEVKGWLPISAQEMDLRTRAGKRGALYLWPHFPDIEDLSRPDIARRLIIEIDQFLQALDEKAGDVVLANLALRLMAVYATFRAEVSNMADHADKKLRALKDNSSGGKQKKANSADRIRMRDEQWIEWAKELRDKHPSYRVGRIAASLKSKKRITLETKTIERALNTSGIFRNR